MILPALSPRSRNVGLAVLVVVVLAAAGAFALYERGLHTGQRGEKIHALDTARVTAEKKLEAHVDEAKLLDTTAKQQVRRFNVSRDRSNEARRKITLLGDTATVAGTKQVLLPEIADYIRASDSTRLQGIMAIAALAKADSAKSIVIADQVGIHKIDTAEVKELKAQKMPRIGFKTGVAVGIVIVVAGGLLIHHLAH